ncbi:MAG: hypothetical protein WD894_11815 [Pirellulales bacterium]
MVIAGEQVEVEYGPAMIFRGDEDSRGHLYGAYISHEGELPGCGDPIRVILDDRDPEPLVIQLANHLRLVADCYVALAKRLESHEAKRRKPGRGARVAVKAK